MIKKCLLGLFVGFVGLISFGYGIDLDHVYQNASYNISPEDSSINFAVYGRGMLSSTKLGNTKRMIAFRSYSSSSIKHFAYFFWYNSMPTFYLYDCGNSCTTKFRQAKRYYLCSNTLAENSTGVVGCSQDQLSDISALYGFFNSIKSTDYWGYKQQNGYQICFSSQQYNSTICFLSSDDYSTSSGLSLSGNLDFVSFPDSYLGDPPGRSTSGSGNGDDDTNNSVIINTSCPTVGQLITSYNNGGFNSGMCYTSDRIYSGGSFVSVDSVSIFDLYSSSDEYVDDVYKYGQYCESSVYGQNVCSEAFSGEYLKFNLISKLPNNLSTVGGRKQLYTYCNLYNLPENATTCTLSGVLADYGVEYTNSDFLHSIVNGEFDFVTPNTSGTVFDGDYTFSGDIISNIKGIYAKFTSLFNKQTGNTKGILPTFIIIPFILIVLFKLFRK